MRKPAFKIGDSIGAFTILKRLTSKQFTNVKAGMWEVMCNKCGNIKQITTSQVKSYSSCGCMQYKDKVKPTGSGKRTKKGTNVFVNMLISIYKSNAKKRDIVYDLSYNYFSSIINEPCVYCGDANENVLKKKKYKDFAYTGIDRVDNNIGYTEENTVPCCEFCNRAKLNNTEEYFKTKIIKIAKGIELDKDYFDIGVNRVLKAQES